MVKRTHSSRELEEIEARPDFDGQLDPNAHELAAIFGNYVFSHRIAAASPTAARRTDAGICRNERLPLTNIAKDCGTRVFRLISRIFPSVRQRHCGQENRERLGVRIQADTVSTEIARNRKGDQSAGAPIGRKSARAPC